LLGYSFCVRDRRVFLARARGNLAWCRSRARPPAASDRASWSDGRARQAINKPASNVFKSPAMGMDALAARLANILMPGPPNPMPKLAITPEGGDETIGAQRAVRARGTARHSSWCARRRQAPQGPGKG
jgi:hypothetical protein